MISFLPPIKMLLLVAFISPTVQGAEQKYPLLESSDGVAVAELPAVVSPDVPAATSEVNLADTPPSAGPASSSADRLPAIAIIIDDLGNQRILGERTVALPGPVACAIMPHTRYSTYLAQRAHEAGKEVLLHLPMQPIEMARIAGPGEISIDTQRPQLRKILQTDLDSVPHAVGVNNHMGSLITRHPGHMRWLMEELSRRGNLFFVDSFTTPSSVAFATALEKGVPAARRHVFLDGEATEDHVKAQFGRLKELAARDGFAIGIGHPYPVTLAYLESALAQLDSEGFRLVSVSDVIEMQPDISPDQAYSEARLSGDVHW